MPANITSSEYTRLRDPRKTTPHLFYWTIQTLSQPELTDKQIYLLKRIAKMSTRQQYQLFIVDDEPYVWQSEPEMYRLCARQNRWVPYVHPNSTDTQEQLKKQVKKIFSNRK